MYFEEGFKEVVGYLTEGRYLVLEKSGSALDSSDKSLKTTSATDAHESKAQRWIIHYNDDEESGIFTISSALNGKWIGTGGALVSSSKAAPLRITFLGNGNGYNIQYTQTGQYITTDNFGAFTLSRSAPSEGFKAYSVAYHD